MALCKVLGVFVYTVVTGGDIDVGQNCLVVEIIQQTNS